MSQYMNACVKRGISCLLVVCIIPWMTGCEGLTGQLWSGDYGDDHRHAAPEPDLKLSQTPDRKDVLVQYDEMRSKDAKIQRHAYLLFANEKTVAAGRKPRFITGKAVGRLQGFPLAISYMTNLSTVGDLTLRVILEEDKHHFTLASNGREIGSYQLPDYMEHSTWVQLLLTPAAVTGDVLIVAGIAAVVVGVLYLKSQSGN